MARGRGRGVRVVAGYVATAIALVVAVMMVAGTAMHAQAESRRAAGQAAQYTPPVLTTPTPQAAPVMAVVGDGDAVQAATGVSSSAHWTAYVAQAENLDVRTEALPGAGYASPAADGRTLVDEAGRVPRDAQLIVFIGGAADAVSDATTTQITSAAEQAVAAAVKRAPSAAIAMIGPVSTDGADEEQLASLAAALQNAAASANIPYVDPSAQVWLDTPRASATALTAADQRVIAKHVETLAEQLLPSLTPNG